MDTLDGVPNLTILLARTVQKVSSYHPHYFLTFCQPFYVSSYFVSFFDHAPPHPFSCSSLAHPMFRLSLSHPLLPLLLYIFSFLYAPLCANSSHLSPSSHLSFLSLTIPIPFSLSQIYLFRSPSRLPIHFSPSHLYPFRPLSFLSALIRCYSYPTCLSPLYLPIYILPSYPSLPLCFSLSYPSLLFISSRSYPLPWFLSPLYFPFSSHLLLLFPSYFCSPSIILPPLPFLCFSPQVKS